MDATVAALRGAGLPRFGRVADALGGGSYVASNEALNLLVSFPPLKADRDRSIGDCRRQAADPREYLRAEGVELHDLQRGSHATRHPVPTSVPRVEDGAVRFVPVGRSRIEDRVDLVQQEGRDLLIYRPVQDPLPTE